MGTFNKYLKVVERTDTIKYLGTVVQKVGPIIESIGPLTEIGEVCIIKLNEAKRLMCEVVGFRDKYVLLLPYADTEGVYPGSEVIASGTSLKVAVSESLKGRILNGIGKPIDGKEDIFSDEFYSIYNDSPHPLKRKRIIKPLSTGIKSIDALLTVGRGQRMGIFSGAGVGKSTLLGMIARYTDADINVVALVGERGREVKDFIIKDLGEDGLRKTVMVVATSDDPPLMRIKGAFVATAIAEYFRDLGYDVNLLMDSVTRVARAQREVGITIGEAPTTRGYPPSVWAMLPKLLERSGTSTIGSITGFYNILVEADEFNEPVSDNVRGILDGHIWLNRALANRGQYPAVDVLNSISRLTVDITSRKMQSYINKLKEIIAVYQDAEDLINIGAYVKGSNPRIDYSISMVDRIYDFMRQGIEEGFAIEESVSRLYELFDDKEFDVNEALPTYYMDIQEEETL